EGGRVVLAVRSRRLAYGVRAKAQGLTPSDDAFCVEPGRERRHDLAAGKGEGAPRAVGGGGPQLDRRPQATIRAPGSTVCARRTSTCGASPSSRSFIRRVA